MAGTWVRIAEGTTNAWGTLYSNQQLYDSRIREGEEFVVSLDLRFDPLAGAAAGVLGVVNQLTTALNLKGVPLYGQKVWAEGSVVRIHSKKGFAWLPVIIVALAAIAVIAIALQAFGIDVFRGAGEAVGSGITGAIEGLAKSLGIDPKILVLGLGILAATFILGGGGGKVGEGVRIVIGEKA